MKLQRSTLTLVAIALLLGGVVLFTEARQANQPITAEGEEATSPVYDFEETDVVGLHVETQIQAVTFERDDTGAWQMVDPEQQPAEEAAIAFLLSRLTTNGLLDTLTIDAANQAEFGLDQPSATIEITLEDNTSHTLILGDADFSGQNAYALIDPEVMPLPQEAGDVTVAVVSQDVVNGVDRPLAEWKAVVESPETPATSDNDESEGETADSDEPGSEDANTAAETDDSEDAAESSEADVEASEGNSNGSRSEAEAEAEAEAPETDQETPETETREGDSNANSESESGTESEATTPPRPQDSDTP